MIIQPKSKSLSNMSDVDEEIIYSENYTFPDQIKNSLDQEDFSLDEINEKIEVRRIPNIN